jgi:hypothetical protein
MTSTKALVAHREIDGIELSIFSDLLTRLSRFRSLSGHAYGGMSGFAMDDQRKLYRTLGERPMLSFDERQAVVARQRFNRPSIRSRVTISSFEHFATNWQRIFVEEGFEHACNHILWVRRDTADQVHQGVRLFQQMVSGLAVGSIARITLNIDYDDWGGPLYAEGIRRLAIDRRAEVREKVLEYLGEFLDEQDMIGEFDEERLYGALALAYGTAAASAVGGPTGNTFEPVSVIRYGAGPVDMTLTGMVVATADRERLRKCVEEGDWPFASLGWGDIKNLRLPDVTSRERFELEASAGDRQAAQKRLHFDLDEATGEEGVFDNFSRYHRYLPATVTAEF